MRTVLEQLQDFQPDFTEIANRAERCRVETKHGRRIFDGELRDIYEPAEERMNGLLERYFAENVEIEFLKATGAVELGDPNVS